MLSTEPMAITTRLEISIAKHKERMATSVGSHPPTLIRITAPIILDKIPVRITTNRVFTNITPYRGSWQTVGTFTTQRVWLEFTGVMLIPPVFVQPQCLSVVRI